MSQNVGGYFGTRRPLCAVLYPHLRHSLGPLAGVVRAAAPSAGYVPHWYGRYHWRDHGLDGLDQTDIPDVSVRRPGHYVLNWPGGDYGVSA